MKQVTDEFMMAVLRMVDCLEDADEQEHYENMLGDGESVERHVYLSMKVARDELSGLGIHVSPERVEQRQADDRQHLAWLDWQEDLRRHTTNPYEDEIPA